jgi:hypothetical protein
MRRQGASPVHPACTIGQTVDHDGQQRRAHYRYNPDYEHCDFGVHGVCSLRLYVACPAVIYIGRLQSNTQDQKEG